jgi:hypothetical protein
LSRPRRENDEFEDVVHMRDGRDGCTPRENDRLDERWDGVGRMTETDARETRDRTRRNGWSISKGTGTYAHMTDERDRTGTGRMVERGRWAMVCTHTDVHHLFVLNTLC